MEFDTYIDKYKQPDMDRINYGKTWQFDHIVPVHLFNLFKDNELRLCYNYMNILPLYNRDNKYKGGSVHFSLHLLQNRLKEYPDNKELPLLINICQEQIDMYWSKYK